MENGKLERKTIIKPTVVKKKKRKKRNVSRQARRCGCERDKEIGRSATEFNKAQRSSTAMARWSATELNSGGEVECNEAQWRW